MTSASRDLARALPLVLVLSLVGTQPEDLKAAESPPVKFPLQVSENNRYLVDADNKPFLVTGDTAWSLIAQLSEQEAIEYLDDRKKRGFNCIIVSLIERRFADKAPATIAGVKPFLKDGDFTQPSSKYFDHAARVIAAAGERGISVWLCPAYLGWGGGDEGWFREVKAAGPRALRSYGKFVGRRFKDHANIVWMPGGDYIMPPEERWAGQELALGIREGGGRQLMTAHGGQTSAVETFGEQDWLAIDNVYRYDPDIWRFYRQAYRQRPVRPFVLIETAYEGEHHATPDRIRRQAWWAVLNGACGQFFGNNPIWYFDAVGHSYVDRKAAPTWRKALDLAGSRDMSRLGAFFQQHPWHRLVPDLDDKLVSDGGGSDVTKVATARTSDGTLALLYVPSKGKEVRELTLDLSRFAGPVRGRWFNPAQDRAAIALPALLTNARGQTVRTPGDNGTGTSDWALVLEVATKE